MTLPGRASAADIPGSKRTKPRDPYRWLAAAPVTLLVALAPAAPAKAQTVLGSVSDAASGVAIPTAEVVLLSRDAQIVGSDRT